MMSFQSNGETGMSEANSPKPGNQWYVEQMRQQFLTAPETLDDSWRNYFLSEAAPPQLRAPQPPIPSSSPGAATGHGNDAPPAMSQADEALAALESTDDEPSSPTAEENVESVTRSDLPPAPPTRIAEATSPYARQQGAAHTSPVNGSGESLDEDRVSALKGVARATAKNMDASLTIPTATTQRNIPAKLLIENRVLINSHLARTVGGKISFTHLIGYALVEALAEIPSLNVRYTLDGTKPSIEQFAHVGLGIAIDVKGSNGERSLMVPVIARADTLTFMEFVDAYQDIVTRARDGKLTADDFRGATVTLTNPGTLGTTTSVPRLMNGQGLIVGVGATDYPAEFRGVSPSRLAQLGIGKTMFMSSTYDHRVIQGAASGQFLGLIDAKLSGRDGFYERVFSSLRVPLHPYAWEPDHEYDPAREKGKPARIGEIIHAFRSRGHLAADTDPLAYRVRMHPDLDLATYGLSVWDLDRPFPTGGFGGTSQMVLRDLLARLRDTYTRSVGIEYMHIQDPEQRKWVQQQIEKPYEAPSPEEQRRILHTLIKAEAFEEFLQTKYMGQKRFSLEGGESLIPLLDEILNDSARAGIVEVAIGMAHRGRLNVLANIAGKSYAQIFSEFEGYFAPGAQQGSGDVKYHLGTWGVYSADDGMATKVYMAANPSHLEAADGVLQGIVHAKQEELGDPDLPIIPVLIHGDAAFIGQGVVQETLNMSQLNGYKTGGTIHIIVNNQIGFTTGPTSGRSTRYPTDLAKGLQVPILHVNADDPEAVVRMAHLAWEYRNRFHKDVIIDMVCYRRRGHNEGDDPSMTQPVMYALIDSIPSTRAVYIRNLVGRGQLTEEEAQASISAYEAELGRILDETREKGEWNPGNPSADTPQSAVPTTHHPHGASGPEGGTAQDMAEVGTAGEAHDDHDWVMPESQMPGKGMMIGWQSSVTPLELHRIGDAQVTFPEGFTPHPKMAQLCERRREMAYGQRPIDWGFGELLAFGTLLMEGTPIRLSGEDSRRATFVQRHAVLHDHSDGREFTPLQFLTTDQASFTVLDSPLSEYAVLAFDYGYSVQRPEALTLWEAQFGDFANGAQTVIDEFVCSAEQKWGQRSSLVMLLPHGYEGQGPDHSSARIERYLQLAAEDNMWIVQPSTPANHFHMLRIQAYKRPRKPLIAFTPKQLLRLSAATSSVDEFTSGTFRPVIGEVNADLASSSVSRVVLCSGRIYYDLAKERAKLGNTSTALIRVEQLYPLPFEEIRAELSRYQGAEVVWVQDEPRNQGAWPHMALNLFPEIGVAARVISRPESATTAAGRASLHNAQRDELIRSVFSA
ncbi:multifunctional oxoglutarate decarboxylase/oxoglutarate dehydrogenase thiamine pyrophosphate-binding subunit/dihydrolipoyllysine-residue succinyltransferase subunit [Schaalia sp. ZJ405]|uniref:multifunctional oxoglutarate decarboxylase/oxoglutarate dehydrogenase thiamine pyrophosphate-binding subunit/dihydrolipoyllysine-residue succinyltransferase subunit n=1 Tax=Schaalia sp. ZJ405 TaxID=2709403 RepID=UPI001E485543|nr:multifunctional oxoglutarate decarboxylase/oxoglutarate dehydrogenase thiamine pyrophosphate-binding subunit/dihydrolipoyllysine-residue succinyltransferase subunit [Schaalia sp. ZJ405]